jgi:GGDEF domain-containing protein
MKHKSLFLICSLLLSSLLFGSVDINGAIDTRLEMTDFKDMMYVLHGAELNIKYTYANESGDRLLAFVQIPFSSHIDSDMFLEHYGDAYLIVKGSLKQPNIRIGRFDIPFGLIKTFDSHTTLLPQLFDKSLGLKKDIGAQVFGFYKIFTYDVSFTQGFNSFDMPRNDKPITARIGIETYAIKGGVSYLNATHSMDGEMKRIGIDFEKNINPIVVRGEAVYGKDPDGKGFSVMLDFPFFFGIEGRGSGLLWKDNTNYQAYGIELRKDVSFLTIGIGLIREKLSETKTEAILQTVIKI